MDTRYMQSFLSVVECGSMAEAARRLNLTPAAIAARIRGLEKELGVSLVQRVGRTVKATEAGLKILERAQTVLREVRDLRATAINDAPVGEFRIGVSTSALTGLLPAALQEMYGIYPKLSIFVEPGTSSNLYHKAVTQTLDAAIIVEPQFAIPKGYEWQLIAAESLVVLAPADLAGRHPHELMKTEPFLRYDRSVWGGRLADRYLQQHNIHPHERLEVDGLMAIARLVACGLGVSLVPDWSPNGLADLALRRVPLPSPVPVRRIGLLWAEYAPHAKLAHTFLSASKKAAAAAP